VINGAVVAKLHYLNQMSLFVTDQACDVMSRGRAVTEDCPSPRIAGPLTVGHQSAAILGWSKSRLSRFCCHTYARSHIDFGEI